MLFEYLEEDIAETLALLIFETNKTGNLYLAMSKLISDEEVNINYKLVLIMFRAFGKDLIKEWLLGARDEYCKNEIYNIFGKDCKEYL